MSTSVLITVTLPTTRVDGSAIALTDIDSVIIFKAVGPAAAAALTTLHGPFTTPTVTFTDSTPDVGQDDNYSADVVDTAGNTSGISNVVDISVPAPLAAPSAPTVAAVLQS